MEQVMVLKVKVYKNSRFREKCSARLLNHDEMKEFGKMVTAYVSCGYEIKVELQEWEL